ncbi:Alpha/Beta hydrolase protein [Lentinula aciculospora]|uniref:Alpha/Beta hydrolase protein n=1 Tax=Lentinula aciculospora TaxID=153920 RepID=A0A9W9AD57_9AGAR|nr:Alpha/Beta hydrolase protein [Lentinula aciculospora]
MKQVAWMFLLFVSVVVSLSTRASLDVPVVDLGYAQYRGVFDPVHNLTSYLGIRYAAPPTGDLRWRAPQSPNKNSSIVQLADTQPLPCFQALVGLAPTNPEETLDRRVSALGNPIEDCLFLNVYFPGNTVPAEPLPTLVWIHGGGYVMGGADEYPGSDLMREANNEIVLVIIQYRLGLFGFLAGSEVKNNGDLNAGLLDQNFALRWVHDHISQFGGDPSKVTIWGESAGAGSVLQHIVAQGGQTAPQLFRGAITSSTFLPSQYMYNDSIPEMLLCKRFFNMPEGGGFYGTYLFVPVVDGSFITQRPSEALKQGKVNGKALLSITNANEGNIFVNQLDPITNVSLYASTLFPKFGSQQANEVAQLYATLGTALQQDDLIMGESIFICPTYYLLNAFPDNGWKGEFTVPPATHGADVVYYFPSIGIPPFPNADFLAAFQGGFMSFVVSQDPNDKIISTITPSWDLYSEGNTEMIFNRTVDYQPDIHANNTDSGLLERCDYWNSVGALTGYAQYQGVFDSVNNLTNYLGIRYAAPPTGNLRWRAPQSPPSNNSIVQQADTQPPACFQSTGGSASTNPLKHTKRAVLNITGDPTEDCLFLNVYFPGDSVPTEPLPTLVWIHGGGYVAGSASEYPGSDLMLEANNEIVVVIIQYRLGLFGFLSGSEVNANGTSNAGLLDQHFALRWVNSYISKFGGDPSKVTIWGESAGAGSVLQHLVAQDGQTSPQLFRGAITSSTFLPSQYGYNDTITEALYSEVVSQTNWFLNSCSSAEDSLACLRAVDVTALEDANVIINAAGFYGTFVFVPVVDGSFITQRPTEALKQGKVNGKALLAITNSNEGTIFVNQTDPITNVSLYASELFPKFGPRIANATAQLYAPLGSPLQQDDLIVGESIFVCPSYYLLSAFENRAWKGEFAIPPATHGSDGFYYFPSIETPPFNNTDFLAAFQGGFMSFVVSQDPNKKITETVTPTWDLYSKGRMEMVFNQTIDNQTEIYADATSNDLLERCKFWDSIGALTGQ